MGNTLPHFRSVTLRDNPSHGTLPPLLRDELRVRDTGKEHSELPFP